MKVTSKKLLAVIIAVVMLLPIIAVSTVALAAEEKTFVLDAQEHLTDMAGGVKKDGESDKVGTDGYFTLYYASKTKIDTSTRAFPDGYNGAGAKIRRINLQTKTTVSESLVSAAIGFHISGRSTVKVWWVQGGDDNRSMAIYDASGAILMRTSEELLKNDPCVSTFTIDNAGSYYLGAPEGNNYVFRVEVQEHEYVDTNIPVDWARVSVPVVQHAEDIGGALRITTDAEVGKLSDGVYADKVTVTVRGGNVLGVYTASSVADNDDFICEISPEWSGTYTVTATVEREGEEPKVSAEYYVDYVLPLVAPYISSATSKGNGTIELEYTETREAEKYEIYCGGELVGETTEVKYMVTGLTVGTEYEFVVRAVRGSEHIDSEKESAVATEDSKITWGFTYYGPSTGASGNGYEGDLNEDGKVTVYSEGGKGKIQPASVDGLAFYYTKIPTSQNFTITATVSVDSWTFSNGQEGFGVMAADRLGVAGDASNLWNNQYMAGTTKIEYRYESDDDGNEIVYDVSTGLGSKYTMKLGLGMIAKTGVTHENLSRLEVGDTDTVNNEFSSVVRPLDLTASRTQNGGTYNVIGNYTNGNSIEGNLENSLLTTFILEIQRNNTGYFVRYYNLNGDLVYEIKNYDPDALDQLDSEYVYAGFYASRNARATFSDVKLTTIDPKDDAPAEERPITYVTPTVALTSPSNTTSSEYTFAINTNVDGIVTIKNTAGKVIVPATEIKGEERLYATVNLDAYGEYNYIVEFNPDDDQDLGEYTELINNNNVYTELLLTYRAGNYHRKSVYVSPDGLYYGTGSKDDPYDLVTAINSAVPGQTIILTEGTYKFNLPGQTLKIERGINGTEEEPIRLIADPEAKTRPVIDFGGKGFGMVHGGNWWIFEGFDVTGSANAQKGFQVSGNHNVLIDIHAYRNGNTGIQLSRYAGSDYTIEDWPSYNLVLNCDSYYNMDAGHEDADGFAAKLTVGPGNVFDGCVAYNNADDGWDLYAKVQTGPIGAVTIKNCFAYNNGRLENGTASKGNGNGFKMGGESITGHHVIINSIAYNNRMKGIDSNSCPDIEVYNCISYNNGNYNIAFYTNNASNTAFKGSGIISFKTNGGGGENLKGKGNQVNDDYINETTYYWSENGVCANSKGDVLDPSEIFVSLGFSGVKRNADGTLNLGNFLKIKEGAVPEGVGTTGEATPSPVIELVPDLPHTYSETWVNTDLYVHWQECECGDKAHIGEHTFEYVIDKEPTETEVGYRHRECTVCGYKKAQVEIQPLGSQNPPEEPSFFQSIIDAIVNFFNQIVEWFQALFVGDKRQ